MRHPCDSECARANNCRGGEVECARCGAPVLRCETDDDGYCADCGAESAEECAAEERELNCRHCRGVMACGKDGYNVECAIYGEGLCLGIDCGEGLCEDWRAMR